MSKQRRTVHFSGTVQGVGFRFTACRVAVEHDVTGYVRNLHDGRVECVAEGEKDDIDAFVESLSRAMSGYIKDKTQRTEPFSGQFNSFGVTY